MTPRLRGRRPLDAEIDEQPPDLCDRRVDRGFDFGRKALAEPVEVARLAADEPDSFGQHSECAGEHQRPTRRGVVHVGELVETLLRRQRVDVLDVRLHDDNRSSGAVEIERVDHNHGARSLEQLVDEVDAADPDLDDAQPRRRLSALETLRDDDPEAVVAAQQVPHPDHDYVHLEQDRVVDAATSVIDSLEERVRRYPPERYPVQHATAQFHLGVALANAGRPSEAEQALQAAVLHFDHAVLPLEHAKALNALGAALRGSGRLDEAASTFRQAADVFASTGERREQGAAIFNLGLVERERERLDEAAACFAQAAELLGSARGAALRELGGLFLGRGDIAAATAALEDAVFSHAELGDELGYGAAANALGLARLAAGRYDDAIAAFRDALGAYPRTVRPHEFAMLKANLALAYEHADDLPRARLAARQALNVPEPPAAVAEQARAVLDRLGPVADDVLVVLADEPRDGWPVILREEVAHWTRGDAETLVSANASPDLIEAWLGALLELPPYEMERAIETTLRVADEQFAKTVRAALPRFHHPQMLRLEAAFGWSSQAT